MSASFPASLIAINGFYWEAFQNYANSKLTAPKQKQYTISH